MYIAILLGEYIFLHKHIELGKVRGLKEAPYFTHGSFYFLGLDRWCVWGGWWGGGVFNFTAIDLVLIYDIKPMFSFLLYLEF